MGAGRLDLFGSGLGGGGGGGGGLLAVGGPELGEEWWLKVSCQLTDLKF